MNKSFKMAFVTLAVAAGIFLIYRIIFVQTIYYEIAGVKIPSRYNILTGTVKPIHNYSGGTISRTVESNKADNIGLSAEQVAVAKLRWAIFEEWVKSHPEYRGWGTNAQTFKKAHDEFRKQLET